MDPPRRNPRSVIDPKVRQVGFFAPPDSTQSDDLESSSSPIAEISPSGNSLSPVMIPPPRHWSDTHTLLSPSRPVGPHYPRVPSSPLRRFSTDLVVGSYNPSDIFPSESDFSEDGVVTPSKESRMSGSKFASSLPSVNVGGGFDLMVGKVGRNGGLGINNSTLIPSIAINLPPGKSGTLLI